MDTAMDMIFVDGTIRVCGYGNAASYLKSRYGQYT